MKGRNRPTFHVKAAEDQAKFWLNPVALASNYGFKAHELKELERIIREYQAEFLEAWHEHLD
jgi:hypothetical protein